MSEPSNDGGPAFPTCLVHWNGSSIDRGPGMSLRDYFAGQYDTSEVKFQNWATVETFMGGEPAPKDIDIVGQIAYKMRADAKLRYMFADAMLAAREARP